MDVAEHRYRRLAADIEGRIERGDLRAGDRLPSLRELRGKLGLGLNTVYQAYVELESLGLIEARPKSGFFVRGAGLPGLEAPRFPRRPAPAGRVRLADITNAVVANSLDPALVPLGASTLSAGLMPRRLLERAVRAALAGGPGRLLPYETAEGAPELRRLLAARLLGLLPGLSEEEVLVTNGCMEAVALSLLAVTSAGDLVAVESPTHFGFLQLLRELGLHAVEVPTDPRRGVVPEALERVLAENPVKACLLMPNFQNPTGALLPEEARREVADLLQAREIPLIEDDIYAELHAGRGRPGLLKGLDRRGLTLACSSFSKVLAPGFRVGWIAAGGRWLERLRRLKAGLSLASPTLQQHALARLLAGGALDRHLRLLRAAVRRQVLDTARAVREAFPADCRFSPPEGGNMLWVELPPGVDGLALYRRALAEGISIVPGAAFSSTGRYRSYVRLSCTGPFDARIGRAVGRLGELIREQAG